MKKIIALTIVLLYNFSFSQNVENYKLNHNHIKSTYNILDYCVSPNNNYVAVYSNSGIYVIDTTSNLVIKEIDKQKLGAGISRMLFSPNSNDLYVAVYDGELRKYPIIGYSYLNLASKKLKVAISFDISNDGGLISLLGLKSNNGGRFWKDMGVILTGTALAVGQQQYNQSSSTSNANRLLYNSANSSSPYSTRRNTSYQNLPKSRTYNRSTGKYEYTKPVQKSQQNTVTENYLYAIQFIGANGSNDDYIYDLKDVRYKKGTEKSIYQYLILDKSKKKIQVVNKRGNAILLKSSSSKGLLSKVNKDPIYFTRSMADNIGFNNPEARYTYQKLGLYSKLQQFSINQSISYEDNIVGPKYILINKVLNNLSWNTSPGKIASSNTYLYTDNLNNSNVNNNRDFTFQNVDIDIPINNSNSSNKKYALIIGNERYDNFKNPSFVLNDSRTFKSYAIKTMGIPANNILYVENGTTITIKNNFNKIKELLKLENGKAEFYFYYAGHMEVDTDLNKCIVGIDAPDDNILKYDINLNTFFNDLFKINTKKNIMFLDACFAGSSRVSDNLSNEYIASRGHIVRNFKRDALRGNSVLFASSNDLQKSFSNDKLKHGIFTYNLLLKLKESKGNLSLAELKNFLERNVRMTSIKLNNGNQTPSFSYSSKLGSSWESWTFN